MREKTLEPTPLNHKNDVRLQFNPAAKFKFQSRNVRCILKIVTQIFIYFLDRRFT